MKKYVPYIILLLGSGILLGSMYLLLNQYNQIGNMTTTQVQATTELKIETLKEGSGEAAKNGDTLSMHYLGTLENGTKFDSSYDRNQPFEFTLGAGEVIKGWDQGILGMKVGEKRKLTIPSSLGYGSQAQGSIPAYSTLIFEVELVEIK